MNWNFSALFLISKDVQNIQVVDSLCWQPSVAACGHFSLIYLNSVSNHFVNEKAPLFDTAVQAESFWSSKISNKARRHLSSKLSFVSCQ